MECSYINYLINMMHFPSTLYACQPDLSTNLPKPNVLYGAISSEFLRIARASLLYKDLLVKGTEQTNDFTWWKIAFATFSITTQNIRNIENLLSAAGATTYRSFWLWNYCCDHQLMIQVVHITILNQSSMLIFITLDFFDCYYLYYHFMFVCIVLCAVCCVCVCFYQFNFSIPITTD